MEERQVRAALHGALHPSEHRQINHLKKLSCKNNRTCDYSSLHIMFWSRFPLKPSSRIGSTSMGCAPDVDGMGSLSLSDAPLSKTGPSLNSKLLYGFHDNDIKCHKYKIKIQTCSIDGSNEEACLIRSGASVSKPISPNPSSLVTKEIFP